MGCGIVNWLANLRRVVTREMYNIMSIMPTIYNIMSIIPTIYNIMSKT